MSDEGIFKVIEKLNNDCGLSWEKQTFSPSERLAIIALRPFLPFLGGRIMQMIDAAIEVEKGRK